MYNFYNSSIIYVSQKIGDDRYYNGLSPEPDNFGNGPFKTIRRALSSIAQRRVSGMDRPITISLLDDQYIEETLEISFEKQVASLCTVAGNGITIESYGDRKKIIGGFKLDGWKKDVFNGTECLSAKIPVKEDGSPRCFDDLFVNGKRASKTRYPKVGTFKAVATEIDVGEGGNPRASSKWFIAHKEDLEYISNIEDATINFFHYWVDEHTPVESYDRESGKLVLKYQPRYQMSTQYEPDDHTSALHYYLENVPEEFSEKNQWYLDRNAGIVYYIPEVMPNNLDDIMAYAPTVFKIFDIFGSADKKISDIRLSNLELVCSRGDCVYIDPTDGISYASDVQSMANAHGTINFKNAVGCSVSDCYIHGTGTYAINIEDGCRSIRVENNYMDDLGAGGVKICKMPADCEEKDYTRNCIIKGNKITNCGKRFAAGCGIILCDSIDNEIAENEIAHLEYSGISVGWVWGYRDSLSRGNLIRDNHIHHVGQGNLSDMGGIYLLGKQPGTIVSGNRIHDITAAHYGAWGLYPDEGSSYVTFENNVIYNTKTEAFHLHYGSYNIVRNNIFAFGNGCIRVTHNEFHDCAAFENNILLTDGGKIYGTYNAPPATIAKRNIMWDLQNGSPLVFDDEHSISVSLEEWQNGFGKDLGSIVADPMFKNAREFDFTLDENSPAIRLGFKPLHGFLASGKK